MKTLSSISISFQQTTEQARSLSACADSLRAVQRQMDAIIGELQGNWGGDAADLYLNKCNQFSRKLNRTAGELDQVASSIKRTAKNYYEAEKRAIRLAQQRNK